MALLPAIPAYLWFTGAGVALAMIDFDLRRLPGKIVPPVVPDRGEAAGADSRRVR